MAKRIRVVLLAAEGLSNVRIARKAGVSRPTVLLWRKRFEAEGPETLWTEDVVGLYLDPPEDGTVLCVDGKSQVQVLDTPL